LSGLYDKIKTSYKFLFVFAFIFTLASCANDSNYSSWPGENTGVVTKNPDVMPDIRWQTPDQRKILSEKLEQTQSAENQGGKLIPSSDIKWKDENYLEDKYQKAAEAAQAQADPLDELYEQKTNQNEPVNVQPTYTKKIKVHLLVPLSGDKADLGMSMLNAAQLALFDVGSENFELVPVDTKGTTFGAREAAQQAINERSDLVLGPVFSENLKEVKPILSRANIPVISFTNDWTLADRDTYIMGFMPFTQVSRVVQYAVSKGYRNFATYAPKTEYCDVVIKTMENTLNSTPATIIATGRYASKQNDVSALVNDFIQTNKVIVTPENMEDISVQNLLKIDEETGKLIESAPKIDVEDKKEDAEEKEEFTLKFDALMLPLGGEGLKSIINQLEINDVDQSKVKYIGTGLWDDLKLNTFPAMYGAWFAAPDPKIRQDFENRFNQNFGKYPVRIASLAYDATALAAVLARTSGSVSPYTHDNLTNQRGFAGIDGIFRFRDDGLSERGLAILEIKPNEMRVIDKAPTAFIPRGNN